MQQHSTSLSLLCYMNNLLRMHSTICVSNSVIAIALHSSHRGTSHCIVCTSEVCSLSLSLSLSVSIECLCLYIPELQVESCLLNLRRQQGVSIVQQLALSAAAKSVPCNEYMHSRIVRCCSLLHLFQPSL